MKLQPDDPAALLMELCQGRFDAFLLKVWPVISGGEELNWNWHLDAISAELHRIKNGGSRRSLINLPPRNGKSKTISVIWVAWMLGNDPTLNFVCVSYSNELSGKLARDCHSLMSSAVYREIFPATILSPRRSASYDFETTRGGGRLATSVTGTLTGRGGDIIILDDVIKPEDANSETIRNSVNEWFRSTLASRLNDKATGAILCVMQRLHENDLAGMLIESGVWNLLSFPAIAVEDQNIALIGGKVYRRKEGDVLHPEREPLAVLEEQKASMGSHAFEAQYQQNPVPAAGNVFKANWFKTSSTPLQGTGWRRNVQSWDTAIKSGTSNDWSVCVTATIIGNHIYIIDVWRGRLEYPDLQRKVIELAQTHKAETLLIEDKASGQQLLQALRAESHSGVPYPIGKTPVTDKYSRAAGVSAMVEAGQVFLPDEGHWVAEFKSELLAFPNGRFDDQLDAFTQLLNWARHDMADDGMLSPPEVPSEDDDDYEDFDMDEGDVYC